MQLQILPHVLGPAEEILQLLKAYSAARYRSEQIFASVTSFDKTDLRDYKDTDRLPVRVAGRLYPVSEQAATRIAGTSIMLGRMASHGISDPPLYVAEVLEYVVSNLRDKRTVTISLLNARSGSVNLSAPSAQTVTCDISLAELSCNALQLDDLDSNILLHESIEFVPQTAAQGIPNELYHIEGEDIKFDSALVTQFGRWLAQLDGWSLTRGNDPFKMLPDEIRLFDGPISMHPLAPIISPLNRIIQVTCARLPIPGLGPLNDRETTVHNGVLYATNSRFIIHRTLGNDADIIIPYRSIKRFEFEEKSVGRRSFYIVLDHQEMLRDILKRMPVPENTRGLSPQTFSDTVIVPYARDLVRQTASALGITLMTPTGGFWDPWERIAAGLDKYPLVRDWVARKAVRAADMGSEFVASFYYFLDAIVEENERISKSVKSWGRLSP